MEIKKMEELLEDPIFVMTFEAFCKVEDIQEEVSSVVLSLKKLKIDEALLKKAKEKKWEITRLQNFYGKMLHDVYGIGMWEGCMVRVLMDEKNN